MKELFCKVCGRPFIEKRVFYCCPECRSGRMKIRHKEPVAKPKKIQPVNHKQCDTCEYRANEMYRSRGLYCDYQAITGVSKVLLFPDCKAPPYCPAYKKRRRKRK